MPSTDVSKPLRTLNPGTLDAWWGPYENVAAACAAIPNETKVVDGISVNFRQGKVVGIRTLGEIRDYTWSTVFTDEGLLLKEVSPVDFEPFKVYIYEVLQKMFTDGVHPFSVKDLDSKGGMWIDQAGFFNAAKYALNSVGGNAIKDNSITIQQIASAVRDLIFSTMDADKTGFVLAFPDLEGKTSFGIRVNGDVVGKFTLIDNSVKTSWLQDGAVTASKLADQAVSSSKLTNLFKRSSLALNNDNAVLDDDITRGELVDIPSYTSKRGVLFKNLTGINNNRSLLFNNSGTIIQVRKRHSLTDKIKGLNYRGEFSAEPHTTLAKTYKNFIYTAAYPSSSGLVAGDYYTITLTDLSIVIGGITYNRGDLAVWTGSVWERHASPLVSAAPLTIGTTGDFWHVTTVGSFGNFNFVPGDIIYCAGITLHGGPIGPVFLKAKDGELFYMDQVTPATSIPNPFNGDLYIASAAGTIAGFAASVEDYLFRQGGSWYISSPQPIVQLATGTCLDLDSSAAQYEVRRNDKSNTPASVKTQAALYSGRAIHKDDILIVGDSMPGTATSGTAFGPLLKAKFSDRNVFTKSYGGAQSDQILQLIKFNSRTEDLYKGMIHVCWHGQNNLTDYAQILRSSLEMQKYGGALNGRTIFISVIGTRSGATFNGSRLVFPEFENAKAGTGIHYNLEQWYSKIFTDNFFNIRQFLLGSAAGRTQKDPQFPGMTEEQVAATYGILPFSYWFNYSGKPFTSENINFTGYLATSAIPSNSEGSDFDYKLRATTGSLGNSLIVKTSGAWTEYQFDVIHLCGTGTAVLADLFYNFLTLKTY